MKLLRRNRRTVTSFVAIGALVLGLAACAPSDSTKTADGAVPDISGNPAVTLSVFAAQFPGTNLATNAFSKELSKKFNITFTWQTTTLDGGPAKEKRQISLASGDYPDAYMLIPWVDQFTPPELLKLGKQGVLRPLQGLIKKYAPNIQKALDTIPEYRAMATAPDGNIYGLPQWNDCYHCSYQDKLWMNSAWLKKLGLEQPKTTKDLVKVLKAFKTQDPNGNGKADEIPLTGDTRDSVIPYLMNAFIYDPQGTSGNNNSTLVLKGQRVDMQANKDGWRAGLKFIKSLYDQGLIDQGAFTQNGDALRAQGDSADATIVGSGSVLHPAIFVTPGQADGRDKNYDAVPPLTGPDGANFTAYNIPSTPGATFALTSKASPAQQVQSIKMMNYIYSTQGQIEGNFGSEGIGWEKPGASDISLDTTLKPILKVIQAPVGSKPTNTSWSAMAQYNNTSAFRSSQATPTDLYSSAGYERRLYEATKLYAGHEDKAQIYPYWAVWIDPSLGSEVATLQTNIENYVQQSSLQFITGSKNIDTGWDDYKKGLDGVGLTRYLQIQQKAYDQSKK